MRGIRVFQSNIFLVIKGTTRITMVLIITYKFSACLLFLLSVRANQIKISVDI